MRETLTNNQENNIPIAKGVASFSGGTVISRILGLVREQVFAVFFGAGAYTDAFFAAFRIPNLLRDLLAEGVFSAAFVPTLSAEKSQKGLKPAFQLINLTFFSMAVITSLICILGIIVTPFIVKLMTPGFSEVEGQMQLTITMAQIMFPLLIFVSLASVTMGVLNTFGYFGIPATAPAMFNIAMIFCGIFMRKFFNPPILSMALGVLVGGAGQLAFQIPAMYRLGFRFKLMFGFMDKRIRKIFKLMLPASIGTAAMQINVFIATILASLLPAGSLSYLNYGFRLMHLPLALFGVAVASVSLPKFSSKFAQNDMDGLKTDYIDSVRFSLFLMIPAIFFILSAAYPIVGTIFQHGKFQYNDTVATVNVLRIYALGLFAFSLVRISSQVFFSMFDTRTPVKVGVMVVAVNIVLNIVLMGPFGYLGLAAATTIAGVINMFTLIIFLGKVMTGLNLRSVRDLLLKIVPINILLAYVIYSLCSAMSLNSPEASSVTRGIMLLVFIVGYIVIYLLICKILKIKEINKIMDLVKRKSS